MIAYNVGSDPFIVTGDGLSLPPEYTKGNFRVLAKAIEVINTTAVIDRQGLCTCARYSQPDVVPYNSYVALGGEAPYKDEYTTLNVFHERLPPANLSEAVLYPQNAQWEAEKGYYAPINCKIDNVVCMPSPIYPLQINEDFKAGVEVIQTQTSYSPKVFPEVISGNAQTFFSPPNIPFFSPQDGTVVFFTGLSPKTTLVLRVRWILERFPGKDEKEILVLASPSCPRDDFALELVSRFFRACPAGVDYGQNPNGEWGKKAISFIAQLAKHAGPVIGMLPFPGAGTLGNVISATGNALVNEQRTLPAQKTRGPKRMAPTKVVSVPQKKKKPQGKGKKGSGPQ